MRDARPQGCQERSARRDRYLAGRIADLTETILRLGVATLVDAFAFLVWNLASRSPMRLGRDLASGFTHPATALRGIVVFVVGLSLLIGAAGLLIALPLRAGTYVVLETWTVVSGLLVEQLVGADVYRRLTAPPQRER